MPGRPAGIQVSPGVAEDALSSATPLCGRSHYPHRCVRAVYRIGPNVAKVEISAR